MLGHDPWKRYRLHPDHRHAGWLTVDGIVAARDPHFFPGLGGAHHRPDVLLLFEADEPNHVEPIDATIDAKVDALLRTGASGARRWTSTPTRRSSTRPSRAFRARVTDDGARRRRRDSSSASASSPTSEREESGRPKASPISVLRTP